MKIGTEDGKKLEKIFDVLELSKRERAKHLEKIGEALLMDVAAEAYVAKVDEVDGEIGNKDDVAKFLLENCSEEEIKEFTAIVFRDAIVEYFSKIVKDLPEEKRAEVEIILNTFE